mmetsp:Transcript_53872/g.89437  ORF Transcript_53872/g.89437 Transcript_53872/m.89437 type:complete len:201 (-) Transcript_53872:607-1209(-)
MRHGVGDRWRQIACEHPRMRRRVKGPNNLISVTDRLKQRPLCVNDFEVRLWPNMQQTQQLAPACCTAFGSIDELLIVEGERAAGGGTGLASEGCLDSALACLLLLNLPHKIVEPLNGRLVGTEHLGLLSVCRVRHVATELGVAPQQSMHADVPAQHVGTPDEHRWHVQRTDSLCQRSECHRARRLTIVRQDEFEANETFI